MAHCKVEPHVARIVRSKTLKRTRIANEKIIEALEEGAAKFALKPPSRTRWVEAITKRVYKQFERSDLAIFKCYMRSTVRRQLA